MRTIDESVYIAEGARVIKDVTLGKDCGVWYNAVIRGDESPIVIGARTNIQDNAVLHADAGNPLTIGDDVTIGHGAIVHGCTIGNNVLIGMGAIILNGAVIGDNSIIGAGALVTQGKQYEPYSMLIGSPVKAAKPLDPAAAALIRANAAEYVGLAKKAKEEQ